jgi:hypothetical protein
MRSRIKDKINEVEIPDFKSENEIEYIDTESLETSDNIEFNENLEKIE